MVTFVRPMNVYVAQDSLAEKIIRKRLGLPETEAIAPGIQPTPDQDLVFHGGKTLKDLNFTNFYIGGIDSWDQNVIQSIDRALAAAMLDQHLNNVMMQYFQNQPITSTFMGSQVLPGAAPAVFTQGDVENLVLQLFAAGSLTSFNLSSTVFNFLLPRGTLLNTDPAPSFGHAEQAFGLADAEDHQEDLPVADEEADSLHGLGGYHGSVHAAGSSGADHIIYYAIGVFSERRPDGTPNGIPVLPIPWKNVVVTFYHELNEARTDPDVEDAIRAFHAGQSALAERLLGWVSRKGDECGDFPMKEARPLTQIIKEVALTHGVGTVPVQFQYSNAVHGPEGPVAKPHKLSRSRRKSPSHSALEVADD